MRLIGTISVVPEIALNERWRYVRFGWAYFHLKNDKVFQRNPLLRVISGDRASTASYGKVTVSSTGSS
jgi:hypothetical protein